MGAVGRVKIRIDYEIFSPLTPPASFLLAMRDLGKRRSLLGEFPDRVSFDC